MICFRDTTFCSSPGCVNACGRQLTRELREAAKRWGQETWGTDDAPISRMRYCDDAGVPLFPQTQARERPDAD